MEELVLQMKHISKSFGGIHALKDVSLNLARGEVLCLVGENGAGKSTLMNILSGVFPPSNGDIVLNGKEIKIKNPQEAYRLGISIVHQELIQIPSMSIAENIFLGRYETRAGLIRFRELYEKTNKLMDDLGIRFDPIQRVSSLSVAQRQLVEILKALSYDSSILVFDEPTAALTSDECEVLFTIIRRLKQRNVSVIFISHRMEDIYKIGDRVLCLRDGEVSGFAEVENLPVSRIIQMMVGRDLSNQYCAKNNRPGEVVFRADSISNQFVHAISFEVRKGEVLGIGGLIGAGRTELLRAIFGIDKYEGTIYLGDQVISNRNPQDAIERGFSFVPEDRKDQGLILMASLLSNTELSVLKRLSIFGFMESKKEKHNAEVFIKKFDVKAGSIRSKASSLSCGNQQKVVLSKCLSSMPNILLLDEPTRGVDVGAKAEIYRIIDELACSGVAIIMVSSELPELLAVSDRIMVMHEGHSTGIVPAKEATEESIMKMAISRQME